MDIFDSGYFKINKYILMVLGCWPFQDDKGRRIIQLLCHILMYFTLVLLVSTRAKQYFYIQMLKIAIESFISHNIYVWIPAIFLFFRLSMDQVIKLIKEWGINNDVVITVLASIAIAFNCIAKYIGSMNSEGKVICIRYCFCSLVPKKWHNAPATRLIQFYYHVNIYFSLKYFTKI